MAHSYNDNIIATIVSITFSSITLYKESLHVLNSAFLKKTQTPVRRCRFAFTQIYINISSLNFREMKIICAQKYHYNQSNSTRNCSIHEIDWRAEVDLYNFHQLIPPKGSRKAEYTYSLYCAEWLWNDFYVKYNNRIFLQCILFAVHFALMFIVTPKELRSQGRCSRCTLFHLILSPQSRRRSHCWVFFLYCNTIWGFCCLRN